MKRILVVMQRDTGDEVTVSIRTKTGNFAKDDYVKLNEKVSREIIPIADDALYFRVRYNDSEKNSKDSTKSIKAHSVEELNSAIGQMFSDLGVEYE